MDFSYLLELAKANEEKDKRDNSVKFSTKVSNAKKVCKSGPRRGAIEQHLSKIEEEKKKKDVEYNKKKEELLALRAKDKHSAKRVKSLITRTKGASKSVLEDAKDITTAKCEEQCDEDDYGYESTMSQQIFSKLQNTYSEMPEDDRLKFKKTTKSNIDDIKKRVMESLKKKQEEDLGIRKRKRNKKSRKIKQEDDGFINDGDAFKKYHSSSDEEKGKERNVGKDKKSKKRAVDTSFIKVLEDKYSNFKYDKSKEKHKKEDKKEKSSSSKSVSKNNPPPMSFSDLMKVAQKKQTEPSPILDPLVELEKLQKKKDEEKSAEHRPMTAKEKKESEEQRMYKIKKAWRLSSSKDGTNPEESTKRDDTKANNKDSSKNGNVEKVKVGSKESQFPPPQQPAPKMKDKSHYFAVPASKSAAGSASKSQGNSKQQFPNPHSNSYKQLPPKPSSKDSQSHSRPPKSDSKFGTNRAKESFPPPSFPRKKPQTPPPTSKRRLADDSDEDYDSEMDDFIDDGDVDVDYSSEIAKMFNYDKSKFRHDDDDIDDMEVSYSQVQKEERFSAKAGLMEDLEDMRKEEEEKKRKLMMMKRK